MSDRHCLIIGAPKCATTWLAKCLGAHSECHYPVHGEVHYFTKHWGRGQKWYDNKFVDATEDQVLIDKSPSYLASAKAAHRIHETIDNPKLIALVRDPVRRAYSHYCMLHRGGEVGNDPDAWPEQYPSVLDHGEYWTNLKVYIDLFSNDAIKCVVVEDVSENSDEVWAEICDFLGVFREEAPDVLNRKIFASGGRPRLGWAYDLLVEGYRSLRKSSFGRPVVRCIENIRMSRVRQYWVRWLLGGRCPDWSDQTRSRLAEMYEHEVAALSDYIGRDLNELWLSDYRRLRDEARGG